METEDDRELREMAEEELASLQEQKVRLEGNSGRADPKGPNDDKDVIVDPAGTGGEKPPVRSAVPMYGRYAEDRRWKTGS